MTRVLVADDEAATRRLLRRMLETESFEVFEACDADAALQELAHDPAIVLLDLKLGPDAGEELIGRIRTLAPDCEVIVMTGFASVDSVVHCMRAGVFDYLEKPFPDRHRLIRTLKRAEEYRALRVRNRELEGELDRRSAIDGIVAHSATMRRICQKVLDLSHNESNVLLSGESGTGKELIARAIHDTSPRRERAFVAVDCGALPETIAEGELFGYERGAFTGAVRASAGVFRSADRGTLFLDEVGELSPLLQSKLLRALQEGEVRPLGAEAPQRVDVRIIAATNRDLVAEVKAERFRSDLFYRLHVVSIALPPLRDRPEDIPVLAAHLLERVMPGSRVSGFEPGAIEALLERRWEGNVRELENSIEAAVALAPGPRLRAADLGLAQAGGRRPLVDAPVGVELSLEAYERACLERALRHVGGDPRRAASLLGIGRSTFYRKLRRHAVEPRGAQARASG